MYKKSSIGRLLILSMIAVLLLSACSTRPSESKPVTLTISAAASVTDALTTIKQQYAAKHPDVLLEFNFGGSGTLMKQIQQGAPVDLFLSASAANMDTLIQEGTVLQNAHTPLLANQLVVIVPNDQKEKFTSITDLAAPAIERIAVGIPGSVPAGTYAKEALSNLELWEDVEAKAVQAKDVRQVLQTVETGNVDAGIVYLTDAKESDSVHIAAIIDASLHTPITYPVGVLAGSMHPDEAAAFYEYLQSEEALSVFQSYGFSLPSGN